MNSNDRNDAIEWAQRLLHLKHFVILDTETTGLGDTDEICQIAMIDADGEILLNTLVRPTVPIEPGAIAIHGITDDLVHDAPTFDQVLVPMMKAVSFKDVVIYNAEYDLRLIRQSVKSYGIQLAFPVSDRRQCRIFTNGGSIHCAMEIYSRWVGDWNDYHGSYRWQKLPGGDHSALGDCRAVLQVIRDMASDVEVEP